MINIIIDQETYSDEFLYTIDANQDYDFNVLDIVIFVQIIVWKGKNPKNNKSRTHSKKIGY